MTRQTEMLNGKLIDSSTNEMVTTQAEGSGLNTDLSPMWSEIMQSQEDADNQRNLRNGVTAPWVHPIHKLRADHEGMRRLQAANIPLGNVAHTPLEVYAAFAHYLNGTMTQANLIHSNGNIYSVGLASGIYAFPDETCDYKWRNIIQQGTACPKYTLECCDGNGVNSACTLGIGEFCVD